MASLAERKDRAVMKDLVLNTLALTLIRGLLFGGRALVLLALALVGQPGAVASAAVAVTLAETARFVFDFGIDVLLVRAIATAATREAQTRAAFEGLMMRVGGALIGAPLVALAATLFLHLRPGLSVAAAVLTMTGLISGVPVAVLQGRLQLQRLGYSAIPLLGLGLGVLVYAAARGAGNSLLLLALAGLEGAAALAAFAQADLLRAPRAMPSAADFKSLMRRCAPIALFSGIVGAYLRLDVWVLASLAPLSLATYTVAYRLFQPGSLLVASIAGVAYASIARSWGTIRATRPTGAQLLLIAATLVALGCAFFPVALWITARLYARYSGVQALLPIFAALLPIVGANGLCTAVLSAHGRFTPLCRLGAFNLVVFGAALLVLVPQRGALGAAAALLISESINLCIQALLVLRSSPVQGQDP